MPSLSTYLTTDGWKKDLEESIDHILLLDQSSATIIGLASMQVVVAGGCEILGRMYVTDAYGGMMTSLLGAAVVANTGLYVGAYLRQESQGRGDVGI